MMAFEVKGEEEEEKERAEGERSQTGSWLLGGTEMETEG